MHGPDAFDCAGLVWYIYHEVLGIDIYKDGEGLSTTTMIMNSSLGKLNYFDDGSIDKDYRVITKGDILLFHRQSLSEKEPKSDNKYPGHCGIYLSNNEFIHATRKLGHVGIQNFNKSEYWTKKLVASKDMFK